MIWFKRLLALSIIVILVVTLVTTKSGLVRFFCFLGVPVYLFFMLFMHERHQEKSDQKIQYDDHYSRLIAYNRQKRVQQRVSCSGIKRIRWYMRGKHGKVSYAFIPSRKR